MDQATSSESNRRTSPMAPTGAVPLSQERLRLLAPAWESTSQGLRSMDDLPLGETEPATIFVWEAGER